MDLTLSIAFIAGLISFISPCVLPLVPAYVGYMGGRMTRSVATSGAGSVQTATVDWNQRFTTVLHSLFFIAGFTIVFIGIGLLSTAFVTVIGGQNISTLTNLIGRLGGIIIILFGLHFMGLLRQWLASFRNNETLLNNPLVSLGVALAGSLLLMWGFSGNLLIWESLLWESAAWAPQLGLFSVAALLVWLFLGGAFTDSAIFWRDTIDRINNALYADTRRDMASMGSGRQGYGGSALMGVVFSAGWTPCIGPVYGAVLTLAANGGDVGQAAGLLAAYSLGLGVPFLLTALALDSAQNILRRLQRHMHKIELVSGAFLILIGVLVASGTLQNLSAQFSTGEFAVAAINLEEQVISTITGQEIGGGDVGDITTDGSNLVITNPDTSQDRPSALQATPVPSANTNAPIDSPPVLGGITDLAETSGPTVGTAVGKIAPDFETVNDSGRPMRLSDHRGEIVLLNFWATWCGPCRLEMPEFETTYNNLQDQGFTVLAVNNRETVADVQGFREELGLTFPLLMDEQAEIQERYGIFSYPSTFIINREGIIVDRHFGPLTADLLAEKVNAAMAS